MLLTGCGANFSELKSKGYQKVNSFPLALKIPCILEQDTFYQNPYGKYYKYSCWKNELNFVFKVNVHTLPRYRDASRKSKIEWTARALRFYNIEHPDISIDSKYPGIIYYLDTNSFKNELSRSEVLFVDDTATYNILIPGDKEQTMKELESIVQSAIILD